MQNVNFIKHLKGVFLQFSKDNRLNPTHISLYIALFQIWNNNRFLEDFYINREEVMRFSKIGSKPELKKENIVAQTKQAFDYLESRSSKQISFEFRSVNNEINTNINKELFGWVIENIIKNSMDAMLGKGHLLLTIENPSKKVKITISDTGKGISKKLYKQIFKPGFTTKKRGWGLGLSLSKRIIEDYHKGSVFVQKSEIDKGTSFQILLDLI